MSRKTVINVADGRELGHVCDMVFNNCGGVMGFIVPGKKSFFKSITSSDNIFIPWNRIIKIGSDVVLVELVGAGARTFSAKPPQGEAQAVAYDIPEDRTQQYAEPYRDDADYQGYACPQNSYDNGAQTVYHQDNS